MGGWDYYCFLCAAGFNVPYDLEHDSEEDENSQHETLDAPDEKSPRALFPKETVAERVQWLKEFRTIGQNRHSTGLTQCYLSGPAEEADYGQAQLDLGDHPNAQNVEEDLVDCYRNGDEENGHLPVHDNCFAILCKVFTHAQGMEYEWTPDQTDTLFPFELDTLFSVLAATRREYQAYLALDYTLQPDQYFAVEWDRIYDYFDPLEGVDVPFVDAKDDAMHKSEIASRPGSDGFFDTLPHELLSQILDLTSQADLIPLVKASNNMRKITMSNTFWKHRLGVDAPWLWEYRSSENVANRDWKGYYNSIMTQTYKPLLEATRNKHVSGLANRRRIWHVCEQVLQLYLETNNLSQPERTISDFEDEVECRYVPMVATQTKPQFKSEAAFFFNTESEMYLAKQLRLAWNELGGLCGISVTTGAGEATFGSANYSPGTASVLEIDPQDWIEKLVLNISVIETWKTTTYYGETNNQRLAVTGMAIWLLSGSVTVFGKTEGNKRLLEPLPESGIVGLKTQSAEGLITHLGFLEHELGMTKDRPEIDSTILNLLWKDHIPSTELRFDGPHTGYWTAGSTRDLTPMHTLLFGVTDVEQSTGIGFASTEDLRYFQIQRSDGTFEEIGERDGPPLKILPIDGPGGERIAGFEASIGHLPVGLTLVTTHGRQAVFGRRRDNSRHGHTSGEGYGVAGIYCSFDYNSTGKDQLSSVGLIQSPYIERPPMDNDGRLDNENYLLWEPQPSPPTWRARGPVYGAGHQGEVAVCIDLSRPIMRIEGLFPAPEWLDVVELGGFTIHYADDRPLEPLLYLGFPPQQWPAEDPPSPETLRKMQRHPGMSRSFTQETDHGKAHVASDQEALEQATSWNLSEGGEKIVAVSVWAGEYLHGIQFHAESGNSSPRWGKCGGEVSTVIHAGETGGSEGGGRIVGLKIILGARRLGYCAVALAPQAVQAMYE